MSREKLSPKALRICGYTLLCLVIMFGVAAANKARGGENLVKEYTVEGQASRHVKFEMMPSDDAQRAAAWYFKYMGLGQYEMCKRLFPEEQLEALNFEQNQLDAQDGRYIEEFIVQEFKTLTPDEYGVFKETYDSMAEKYGYEEYRVIRVHFSQKWTEKALEAGPQWGDGVYVRDFVVGKPSGYGKGWRIFELGMM